MWSAFDFANSVSHTKIVSHLFRSEKKNFFIENSFLCMSVNSKQMAKRAQRNPTKRENEQERERKRMRETEQKEQWLHRRVINNKKCRSTCVVFWCCHFFTIIEHHTYIRMLLIWAQYVANGYMVICHNMSRKLKTGHNERYTENWNNNNNNNNNAEPVWWDSHQRESWPRKGSVGLCHFQWQIPSSLERKNRYNICKSLSISQQSVRFVRVHLEMGFFIFSWGTQNGNDNKEFQCYLGNQ